MDHVTVNNPEFNLAALLRRAITEEWDSQPDFSPPASPILNGTTSFLSDLSDLSDLSESSVSTPVSPLPGPTELPDEDGEIAEEYLCDNPPLAGTSQAPNLSRNAKRKARRHERSRKSRKKARARKNEAIDSHHIARQKPIEKYVQFADSIECQFDIEKLSVSSTAYVASRDHSRPKKIYKLSEVTGKGSRFNFRLIEWDGLTPTPIIDQQRRIIGILAGHPNDEKWPELQAQATKALERSQSRVHVPKTQRKHRRGAFPALRCGVSHGGGQRRPTNLRNESTNRDILEELNNLEPFRRTAGFSSSVMATWAPDLHCYYTDTVNELHASDPSLIRIFPSAVFSAASYNLGPQTACYPHIDGGNLAYGSCSVTPHGIFDHKKGGHLILWDLHLVIEFPAGSTILLPSAIVAHSNTAIGKGETRYSFAQYTAGAIFRWVENGCTKRETYLSSLSPEDLAIDEKKNEARWKFGLSLFPIAPQMAQPATVDEVCNVESTMDN